MPKKIDVSLIICTKDRATSLRQCLDALDTRALAEVSGEAILVDNGSTDETPQVMRAFKEVAHCPVAIIKEPAPGLGRARNTGISNASGDVLVFTDDDCYLGDNYFEVASAVFDEGDFHFCGGRILLHDPTDADYACNRQETFERIPPHSFMRAGKIQGANMVVHRRVIESAGLFHPGMGAGTPFRCEDIEFCARALLDGFAGAHVPELVVYHHHRRKPGVDIERLSASNDVGRGVYYARFIMMGEWRFLYAWRKMRLHSKNLLRTLRMLPETMREVRGALRYAWAKATGEISENVKSSAGEE